AEKGGLRSQDHSCDIGREELAGLDKGPIPRLIADLHDDVVGRQRRPADLLRAAAPLDVAGSPFAAGNPDPAEIIVPRPATVMERDPPPLRLAIVGCPVPTVVIGIDPVPVGIGSPIAVDVGGLPDFAPTAVLNKLAVWLKRGAELDRNGGAL